MLIRFEGTFSEMGIDIIETIKHFGGDRIHFVHFRDVIGDKFNFTEVFQDEGQTDMYLALKTWREVGFKGPIRPDHVPLLAGEEPHSVGDKAKGYFSGKASGYTMLGRLYAVGYMRGLLEAVFHETSGVGSLWMMRHGQRYDHVSPKWRETAARPYDSPLTERGFEDAKKTAKYFKGNGIQLTHILVSPYLRALQTATEIANVLNLPLLVEYGLSEYLDPNANTPITTTPSFNIHNLKSQFPKIDTNYISVFGKIQS